MAEKGSPKQFVIHKKITERRDAVYAEFPDAMLPQIKEYLSHSGIKQLYVHQADMFNTAMEGGNTVITTSTASGKTLSFLLPVLQEILSNPQARAIFIYPTKALASDQYRAMSPLVDYFGNNKISIGVYDGDTPPNERSRIRNSANIILTNPEMLNSAFLPHHSKYGFSFIFSNLRYVVIDELHSYRGAFGSHFANIFRRLNRICRYYATSPQFLCSSATIANPVELAENICGKSFKLIDNDGSPAPQKQYYFLQPPFIQGANHRVMATSISADLIPELVMEKRSFLAFCKSRKAVEVVLKESRDKLSYDGVQGQGYSHLISGYRGGYKPQERQEIERKMISGKLQGLVATNALELGIDIGKVDTTILTGYPGTRASFWQQAGRAGRSGQTSDTYLILDNLPFDQYLAIEPDWLFETGSESAVIDKNNLYVQFAHVRAAAAELPLTLDDVALFPDLGEIMPVLVNAKELRSENGKYIWSGKDFPAGDYSLRNMDKERYRLTDYDTAEVIAEMDETQAFREIHEGAIYMHDGQSYQVLTLNLQSRTAQAKAIDENFYTVPHSETILSIIKEQKGRPVGRTRCSFGDVKVNYIVGGYKKLQFHNHQNLGYQELESKLSKSFDTEGVWIDLPQNVEDIYRRFTPFKINIYDSWKSYFDGICFALHNAALMATMTTRGDVEADSIQITGNDTAGTAICIYDLFIGGLGYAEKAYDLVERIIDKAITMVSGCKCADGCPVCVGDYNLDRAVVLWGLKNLYEETAPPADIKLPPVPQETFAEKPFSFDELADEWIRFAKYIFNKGEYLSNFISSIESVRLDSPRLILLLNNEFYVSWLLESDNKTKLQNMIAQYVDVPRNFAIDVDLEQSETRYERGKLERRYNDLTSG
ncbi:MAG: DEAD/DEAH box helicase [Saccharofermentanales bacterium]